MCLDCIALARSMPAGEAGDYASIRATLAVSVRRLAAAGADFFVCPDNARTSRSSSLGSSLPWLACTSPRWSPGRPPATRVGGSVCSARKCLVDAPLYPRSLAARGIAAELSGDDDRQVVNQIIFEELLNGVFYASSRRGYMRIIAQFADRGCDAVALVCIEIPLLVTPDASPLRTLDSTRLLARAAFDVAVGHRAMPTWRGGPGR
jgi:aspartate/glutamate racemase